MATTKKPFDAPVEIYFDQTLGIGSYGLVCKAKYGQLPCAAKVLHQSLFHSGPGGDYIATLEKECQFLSAVKHPNIVQHLGTTKDPSSGRLVLLMELLEESLTRHLEQAADKPLPYQRQVNIAHDIALALLYLHSNVIIHRDLSSNNVLLSCGGSTAKVSDFGLHKLLDSNPCMSPLALSQGTVAYMPPEVLLLPPKYSSSMDCFSLGVLLLQIMTRRYPEPGDAHRYVEHSTHATGRLVLQIPEAERRKGDIDQVPSSHPLLGTAMDCLKDREMERPTADKLCQQLDTLKTEIRYALAGDESESQGTAVQELQQQIESKENIIGALQTQIKEEEKEAHKLKQLAEELKQQIEARDKTIGGLESQMKEEADKSKQILKQLAEEYHSQMIETAELHKKDVYELNKKLAESKQLADENSAKFESNEAVQRNRFQLELEEITKQHEREVNELKKEIAASKEIEKLTAASKPERNTTDAEEQVETDMDTSLSTAQQQESQTENLQEANEVQEQIGEPAKDPQPQIVSDVQDEATTSKSKEPSGSAETEKTKPAIETTDESHTLDEYDPIKKKALADVEAELPKEKKQEPEIAPECTKKQHTITESSPEKEQVEDSDEKALKIEAEPIEMKTEPAAATEEQDEVKKSNSAEEESLKIQEPVKEQEQPLHPQDKETVQEQGEEITQEHPAKIMEEERPIDPQEKETAQNQGEEITQEQPVKKTEEERPIDPQEKETAQNQGEEITQEQPAKEERPIDPQEKETAQNQGEEITQEQPAKEERPIDPKEKETVQEQGEEITQEQPAKKIEEEPSLDPQDKETVREEITQEQPVKMIEEERPQEKETVQEQGEEITQEQPVKKIQQERPIDPQEKETAQNQVEEITQKQSVKEERPQDKKTAGTKEQEKKRKPAKNKKKQERPLDPQGKETAQKRGEEITQEQEKKQEPAKKKRLWKRRSKQDLKEDLPKNQKQMPRGTQSVMELPLPPVKEAPQPPPSPRAATLKWRQGKPSPENLSSLNGTAVVHQKTVYVSRHFDIHSYQVAEDEWKQLATSRYQSFALTVIDDKVTTIGGISREQERTKCLFSLAESNKWDEHYPPIPTHRVCAAALTTPTHLVVAGGRGGRNELTTVEVLNRASVQWSTAISLPVPMGNIQMALCSGHLYVCAAQSFYSCSLEKFLQSCREEAPKHPTSNGSGWTRLADTPNSSGHCLSTLGERVLMMGGCDADDRETATVHCFDAATGGWSAMGEMPAARTDSLAVEAGTEELVVLGGWSNSGRHDTTEIAELKS